MIYRNFGNTGLKLAQKQENCVETFLRFNVFTDGVDSAIV